MTFVMKLKEEEQKKCVKERCSTGVPSVGNLPCAQSTGKSDALYYCNNVDMISLVSVADLACGADLNDIWGWTDPKSKGNVLTQAC